MRLGIIGCGVTGGALRDWLKKHRPEIELRIYDPGIPEYGDKIATDCDAYFICIPVPTAENYTHNIQSQDALYDAIENAGKAPAFIRSTVLPGTCSHLRVGLDKDNIFAMPEFLTERRALEDMEKLPIMVGLKGHYYAHYAEDFINIFGKDRVILATNEECELAKYTHNAFAALKVGYFNLIHKVAKHMAADYDTVVNLASITGFIEKEHTMVPGPDGQFGFGGKCLPKDLLAFNNFVREILPDQNKILYQTLIDNYQNRFKC